MAKLSVSLILVLGLAAAGAYAATQTAGQQPQKAPSVIVEVQGTSCMGQEKSRQQARTDALAQAKRKASEQAVTYISSETRVENGVLMKDLIDAYSKAEVKIISQTDEGWFKEEYPGALADECFRVRIKAEVLPDVSGMQVAGQKAMLEDPTAPLTVRLWTSREEYRRSQKIRIYLRGNKPFYALITYQDASGKLTQLLPNPYRSDTYFKGGVVYELPSGEDHFELEVWPPYGQETITVYAATAPIGGLDLSAQGGVFDIKTKVNDVGLVLRGMKTVVKTQERSPSADVVEFAEAPLTVTTKE